MAWQRLAHQLPCGPGSSCANEGQLEAAGAEESQSGEMHVQRGVRFEGYLARMVIDQLMPGMLHEAELLSRNGMLECPNAPLSVGKVFQCVD